MAGHPVLLLAALLVSMTSGAVFVGFAVEVVLVGTSRLGLTAEAGLFAAAAGALISLALVAFLLFAAFTAEDGDDDDDWRKGDDEPPEPEGPSGEPAWWPGFERELSDYLSDAERSRTKVPV